MSRSSKNYNIAYQLFCRFATIYMLIAIAFSVSGCSQLSVQPDIRRECSGNVGIDRKTRQHFDPYTVHRPSPAPIVKVLTFSDNGELHDRCEWSDVLYEIKDAHSDLSQNNRPKFVIIYVHGWKNDGSEHDEDLMHFTDLIARLTAAQNDSSPHADVIGVYVAWPGASTKVPVLENLTFWGRKGAADRVAIGGNLSKFISAVANIRRQRNNPDDFIVGIGHSFGARILFSAASPLLLHELQMSHPGYSGGHYSPFTGPMDLTVLLNPAFEASRYTAIDSSRRLQEMFSSTQQPLLLSVSTTNDIANRIAFPIGQFIGSRWSERERITLGNYPDYATHELHKSETQASTNTSGSTWYDHYCRETLCLDRVTNDPQPGNPFLVANTTGDILNGHNGIWNKSFQDWLLVFINETKMRQRVAKKFAQ